jgi:hypothetical protein
MSILVPSKARSFSIRVETCTEAFGKIFFKLFIEKAGFVMQRRRFQREPRARNLHLTIYSNVNYLIINIINIKLQRMSRE